MLTILSILSFYLIGSIPTFNLVARLFNLNLTELMNTRPNYLILFRPKAVFAVALLIFLDFFKTIVPLYVGYLLKFSNLELSYFVIALLLGHYYSIFNYFKGNIATTVNIAAYATVGWPVLGVAVSIWILFYFLSGYRVIANIFVALLTPIYIYYVKEDYLIPIVTLSCVIILRHTDLLVRIRYGYYLPDTTGLLQLLTKNRDFLV